MVTTHRTDATNKDFIQLVQQLDVDLAKRDGKDHAFYHQFNSIENLKHTIILYEGEKAIACGAIKAFDAKTMEIKRMYVVPESRGNGLATKVVKALELWTVELGHKVCILETGKRQPEAIALYKKNGYQIIPNYGQYEGIENSICFQKIVSFY